MAVVGLSTRAALLAACAHASCATPPSPAPLPAPAAAPLEHGPLPCTHHTQLGLHPPPPPPPDLQRTASCSRRRCSCSLPPLALHPLPTPNPRSAENSKLKEEKLQLLAQIEILNAKLSMSTFGAVHALGQGELEKIQAELRKQTEAQQASMAAALAQVNAMVTNGSGGGVDDKDSGSDGDD